MALLPLLWLIVQRERRPEWWWLAGAFAVSWVTDAMTLWGSPILETVYPITQAGMVLAVFTQRRAFLILLGGLVIAGLVAVAWEGTQGPSVLLETVAAAFVVRIVWPLKDRRLRATLLVWFGLGWVMWVTYTLWPGLVAWGGYQAVRALSIGLFCWASLDLKPHLRLVDE